MAVFPTYLRKTRGSDWYWSGQSWVNNLIEDLPGFKKSLRKNGKVCRKINEIRNTNRAIQRAFTVPSRVGKEDLHRIFRIKLWEIQEQAARVMACAKRLYLTDDVGLGKTFSAFAALVLLREWGKIDKACVVTLASVKYQWQSEIEAAVSKAFRKRYRVVVVDGTREQRDKAYNTEGFIHVVNYESLRIDSEKGRVNPFTRNVDAFILDEAWKIKNSRTEAHKTIARLFRNCQYRYALNAAPIGNGYIDLFGVFKIVNPLVFICMSNFSERYLTFKKIKLKGRPTPIKVPDHSKYKKVGEIKQRTKGWMLRRASKGDLKGVPKMTVNPYWVELSEDQRKRYRKIKKSPKLNPLSRIVHARTNCLFTDKTRPEKSPKYYELIQILREVVPDKKVIVF
jgi:SNF2 family DNA or RNA helicase